jgi:hypothetical protein
MEDTKTEPEPFTPGPWRTFELDPDYRGVQMGAAGGFSVQGPQAAANVRLIAAAPDLFAACRLALGPAAHYATEFDDAEAWHALRAAIAKAEGRAT